MSRESDFRVYTGLELINTPTEEEKYLIEGVLWEGDHAFLLGREKVGKSILALQMAMCLTSGTPFLSKYEIPEPVDVLYVQTEGKKHDTVERIKAMVNDRGLSWDPRKFHLLYYHSFALDTGEGLNHFRQLVQPFPKPKVMILDPLYMSMQGDMIDNHHARAMVRNLRKITEEMNCALLILHHQHRPYRGLDGHSVEETTDDSIFGSFVWKAFADHVLSMYMRKDKVRLLTCNTQRTSRVIENVELNLIAPYPLYFEILGEDQKPYIQVVYDYMKGYAKPITAQGIGSYTKLSPSAIKKSLMILIKEGKVKINNIGHRPCLYEAVC